MHSSDEVSRLPTGAVKLAQNDHSEHQAFSYDQGGVSFWGAQYHPELRTTHVAYYLEDGDSIFAGKSAYCGSKSCGNRCAGRRAGGHHQMR